MPLLELFKPKYLFAPGDDLPLDIDRAMIAPADVAVHEGGKHLSKRARRIAAAMDPAKETGMGVPCAVGEN